MGTRFREFPQTPRGWGFSLLGFILCLRAMLMFQLVGREGPFDRSQNLGPNCLDLWNPNL